MCVGLVGHELCMGQLALGPALHGERWDVHVVAVKVASGLWGCGGITAGRRLCMGQLALCPAFKWYVLGCLVVVVLAREPPWGTRGKQSGRCQTQAVHGTAPLDPTLHGKWQWLSWWWWWWRGNHHGERVGSSCVTVGHWLCMGHVCTAPPGSDTPW